MLGAYGEHALTCKHIITHSCQRWTSVFTHHLPEELSSTLARSQLTSLLQVLQRRKQVLICLCGEHTNHANWLRCVVLDVFRSTQNLPTQSCRTVTVIFKVMPCTLHVILHQPIAIRVRNIIQNSVKSMHENYLKEAKDSPKESCSLSIHGLHHLSTFSIKRFIIDYKVHLSQDC